MIIPKSSMPRPVIDLTGSDGNVFQLIAVYHRTLKNQGLSPREVRAKTIAWYKGRTYAQVVAQFVALMGDRVDIIMSDELAKEVKGE